MVTAKENIADMERHVNNYFNPENSPGGKRKRPPELLALAKRILDYRNSKEAQNKSMSSSKVGQVSVTFVTVDGVPADWTQIFKRELDPYRRAKFI